MNGSVDYKYSLDLLRRINHISVGDHKLINHFYYKEYNLWQTFQVPLFAEIREYSKEKNFEQTKSTLTKVKAFAVSLLFLFISFLSALLAVVFRKSLVLYSVDKTSGSHKNDFRLEPLYEAINESRVGYLEIFHTTFNMDTLRRFFLRGRMAIYPESLDSVAGLFYSSSNLLNELDLSSFSREEQAFVSYLISKYEKANYLFSFKQKILSFLFRLLSPKFVFAIDDMRHNFIVIAAAKGLVNSHSIMHGRITKYEVGHLIADGTEGKILFSDLYLVWNGYWEKEILKLGSIMKESEIIKAGLLSLPKDQIDKKSHQGINVLVPYEHIAPAGEVKEYIDKMLALDDVKVYFKTRPDMGTAKQLAYYNLDESQVEVVESLDQIAPVIDMVVGTYSNFLYDVMAYNLPSVLLETSLDYGEGLVTSGLGDKLSLSDLNLERLQEIADTPESMLDSRREKLYGKAPKLMKDTIIEILNAN